MRKILIFALTGLCALFAIIAFGNCISDYFRKNELQNRSLYKDEKATEWGYSLELLGRQNKKLIFFTVKGVSEFNPDDEFKELLDNFFYVVELDPEQWPGDYRILQNIFWHNSQNFKPLAGGILFPTLSPLYLFSDLHEKDGDSVPSAYSAAKALIVKFINNPTGLAEASKKFLAVFNLPSNPPVNTIYNIGEIPISWNVESIKLNDFFSRDTSNYPLAMITENARLAARILYLSSQFKLAEKAALKAQASLINIFQSDNNLTHKLLCVRALFEIAIIANSRGYGKELLEFSDSIVEKIQPDGRMMDKGSEGSLADNALSIHILTLAYSYSNNSKYIEAAKKICDSIEIIFKTRGQLPSLLNLGKVSQSSSIAYAFVAKAFSDMYYFTGDKKYIALCKLIFDEWNKLFISKEGVWAMNSYASPLANITRPIIFEDAELPSYIGEAAQTVAYLKTINASFDIPNYQKIDAACSGALRYFNIYKYTMASWKISKVPNVSLGINTSK